MEVFPVSSGGLTKSPSTSTNPSTRRSSRASSSPTDRSRTRSGTSPSDSTYTPNPRPRPRLTADFPALPDSDQTVTHVQHTPHNLRGLTVERPTFTRFHSSDASRPSAPMGHAHSASAHPSKPNSRRVSPSRLVNGVNSTFLYPPKGDSRKRAASLDDLQLPVTTVTLISKHSPPPEFSSPLATSTSINSQSTSHTINRASQYGKRRWHALMELVSTEESYVRDLKILVRIYLVQLESVTALDLNARMEVARNADALLQLHKKIYRRLNKIITDERIRELKGQTASVTAERNLDRALGRVAGVFVKEASSFHLYESFCAGHSQALDLIRQVQGLSEWDMYEKRCAVIVADERANADAVKSPEVYDTTPTMGGTSPPTTSRRHSTDVSPNLTVDLPRTSKLTMRDFLIMPIQRICRYPLMLRQLQLNGGLASPPASPTLNASAIASTSTLGISLEVQALDAMKQVAAKVDEARRRTDVAIKSRLIVERISDQALPQLSLFGDCLLAGSLDVVYHHETLAPLETPVKVKYLGAFLYGGWMLLTKVLKNKIYEPRHWFPLSSVYLVDIPEDEALLPASFRLSSGDHHFEFAAACSQEKTLWMNQIRFAQTHCALGSTELPSSLEAAASKPSTPPRPSSRSPSRKATNPTPMVSVPCMVSTKEQILVNPPNRRSSLGALTADGELLRLLNPALAFMASTAPDVPTSPVTSEDPVTPSTPVQLKNLLEGDLSTILIRRASTNHRRMVDQSLHDVFFEECQGVRIQAQMKTPLFQPPKLTTESGSIAARNKMTRRESVLLKRQRSVADAPSLTPSGSTPKMSTKFALSRNKSTGIMGSREQRRRTLAIPSFSFFEERGEDQAAQHPNTADSSPYSSMTNIPTVQTNPDQFQSPEGPITFQTRRDKAKRTSRMASQFSQQTEDKDEEAKVPEPNVLKELPPVPSVKRRSTFILPTSRSSSEDKSRFSLTPRLRAVDRRHSSSPTSGAIFAVGQGLSNLDPEETSGGSVSRLHPGAIIRRSLTLIGSRRMKNNSRGYVANLFNRSATSVLPDGDGDSSIAHKTRSEPCPTPPKRLSASTPALQEPLSTWEILPSAAMHQFDTKRSASDSSGIPPLPPLPHHAHTPRPSKSTLRRRSSQKVLQHLNPLTYLLNRDS